MYTDYLFDEWNINFTLSKLTLLICSFKFNGSDRDRIEMMLHNYKCPLKVPQARKITISRKTQQHLRNNSRVTTRSPQIPRSLNYVHKFPLFVKYAIIELFWFVRKSGVCVSIKLSEPCKLIY